MRTKVFCIVVLCACLFIACEKDNDDYEPVKPPVEQPEKPVEPDKPATPPSTSDIINVKIGDIDMIVGTNNWNAIAYGNGKYAAVSGCYWGGKYEDAGYATSSTDGKTWTTPRKLGLQDGAWNDIIFFKGKFIVVGQTGNIIGSIAISADGINWTIKNIGKASTWKLIAKNGDESAMILGNGWYRAVTTDGETWQNTASSGTNMVTGLNFTTGLWFALGNYGLVQWTKNLYSNNWEFYKAIGSGTWKNAFYVNESFLLIGSNYSNGSYIVDIAISADNGLNWKLSTGPTAKSGIKKAFYHNGKFVILFSDGTCSISANGKEWSEITQLIDTNNGTNVASINNYCLIQNN